MQTLTSEQFWQFSVEVYSDKSIANACLALQDHAGLNVNLLLLCIWADTNHCPLSDEWLLNTHDDVNAFDCLVIAPLREARRGLPNSHLPIERQQSIKRHMLDTELMLERDAQSLIISKLTTHFAQARHAQTTIERYVMQCVDPLSSPFAPPQTPTERPTVKPALNTLLQWINTRK